MPTVLDEFPGRSRTPKWDEIFNDCTDRTVYNFGNAEFDCTPASFRAAAKNYAKRVGKSVRTSKTADGVAIEFTGTGNGEAPAAKRKRK